MACGTRVRLVLLIVAVTPRALWAGALAAGSEFQVNAYTTGAQYVGLRTVDADAAGNFVVVWYKSGPDDSFGIFARRYASSGAALGTEFRVNSYTTGVQELPSLSVTDGGDFVISWTSSHQDGASTGVFAQRYASSGAPMGTEFRVNTYTLSDQSSSSVSCAADGSCTVAWISHGQDGSGYGIFAQHYASTGSAIGTEFRVNTYTTSQQTNPSVSTAANGDIVVVWASNGQKIGTDVFGQRYASNGSAVGTEFAVNTYTNNNEYFQEVSAYGDGNFVVVWHGYRAYGGGQDVFGQRFDDAGAAVGTEFLINTYTTNNQGEPSVSAGPDGSFVVLWSSSGQDGDLNGVFGQRFDSSGTAAGTEFPVNTYTSSYQDSPAVAMDEDGDFVAVWQSRHDGDVAGLFAQRYQLCGNGALGNAEQCDDGNGSAGDCCSVSCTAEAEGSACASDGNVCSDDRCNGSGTCVHIDNSAPCDDGLFCNGGDTCAGGVCSHVGDPCPGPDGDGNCAESCDEQGDNCTAIDPDGVGCDDGLFCTATDTCNDAVCSGSGDPCPGADGDSDCTESCDEAANACLAADPEGSACDDGTFCNGVDHCQAALCSSHGGDPCAGPDGDSDCSESCDETANACTEADPEHASCDDGNQSTSSDMCVAGVCTGSTTTAVDHYRCYQGRDLKQPAFTMETVNTTDQITSNATVRARKLKYFCAATDTNGTGVNNPNLHLACYQVSGLLLSPRPGIEVSTQFQTSRFELNKPKLLCLPATMTVLP